MSLQPPPEPETEPDQRAQDAQFYRRVLHETIEISLDFARKLNRQASSEAEAGDTPPASVIEPALAFDRIARTIRRTIHLARMICEPVPAPAAQPRVAARKRIIREVEDVIQRTVGATEAETLQAELQERLDSPDLDEDIAQRPVAEIIADICRDLGIAAYPGTHPWKRRTPADVAALCARAAGAPRSRPPVQPSADPGEAGRPQAPQRFSG